MSSFTLGNSPVQEGRIAIVTGANIGLGYETALGLAKKRAKVILACRDLQKAEMAKNNVLRIVPGAELEIIRLDLRDFSSVRAFAKIYQSKHDRLDILINNAGIMVPPFSKTKDGFESQMGVNYFGHFLLTKLLYSLLSTTQDSRVVSLSSNAHKGGKIDFDNLNSEKSYSRIGAYAQSKLACLMFAYELQRRLDAAGIPVISVAAHPGVSITNLGRHIPKWLFYPLLPIVSMITHSPENGALPSLYAALGQDVRGGDYFGPTGFKQMNGKPGKVSSTPASHDEEVAGRLWQMSEELTGGKFEMK